MHTGLLVNEETYNNIKKYINTMDVNVNTGMIMDEVPMSEANNQNNEAMQAAISNNQMKKFEAMAKAWKDAHTQKIREYKKIGRNDLCPCGSGKKYKNCCLDSGKYENIINNK